MTALAATIVDTDALLRTVVGSLAAAVTVTLAFSIAIFGATKFVEMRRDGRAALAFGSAMLTALALLVCAGILVLGIVGMTQK